MNVLVTGGLGYIGSHICEKLISDGCKITVVDNLSNSDLSVVEKINQITGKGLQYYIGDILDEVFLDQVFCTTEFDAVIHLAGLKAVGESVSNPLSYYQNNVSGSINLLKTMQKYKVHNIVFSSSATVYGEPQYLPIDEEHQLGPVNPYGHTKLLIENILSDLHMSSSKWSIVILRYFNPIGAHESGLIGDNPNGLPNNLMPFISRVAQGYIEKLKVFGDHYSTIDGTGVRDYIHVSDLACGHFAALEYVLSNSNEFQIVNLGTGIGTSVLELISAYEKMNKIKVPYEISKPRSGDVDSCFAMVEKAERLLGWKAHKNIEDMCLSTYNFEKQKKVETKA